MSDASVRARIRSGRSLRLPGDGRRRHAVLAALALLAAATPFVLRVVRNAPGSPVALPAGIYEPAIAAATLGPAIAAAAVAVGTADPVERVALLGLAVFAPLALVADAAYVPAAIVLPIAGGVVAWRRLDADVGRTLPGVGRRLLAAAAVAAVGCSLAATVGLAPFEVRRVGTVLALGAAVAAGVASDAGRIDWAAGLVAASLVYAAGTAAPYVTGAVSLVAGGVVGASLPLLAAGVGGLAAATVASLRRGAFVPASGALLVLVAGVPATVPRALAAIVGVAFLLGGERA